MRDPLDIRQFELYQSFAHRFLDGAVAPTDAFTLDACAAQVQDTVAERDEAASLLPPGARYVTHSMTCIISYYEVMLDSEATFPAPIPGWTTGSQRFTDWLANESFSSARKRKEIDQFVLRDILPDIVTAAIKAGITEADVMAGAETSFDTELRGMKSLGLWREIYQDKHGDRSTKWDSNDLTDMFYLSCAAGYADYILGERSLTSRLRQGAKRLGRSIKIYSNVGELASALRDDGYCMSRSMLVDLWAWVRER